VIFRAGSAAWPLFLVSGWATAHPVDEVVQGAYLTLAPGEVRLELDVTPGAEVADSLLRSLDADADHHITDAESQAFAERVLKQSTFSIDGRTVSWRFDRVSVPPYQNLNQLGDTLKIYAVTTREDRTGSHTLIYDNRYRPAKSQCIANIFLQPGKGWRYQVASQQHSDDGRQLTVRYTVIGQ
jgi:hypothetical protein